MKILHYALGFPPYRSGGLTKFCVDLMEQQIKEGNSVAMLWPGQMKLVNKATVVKKHKNVKIKNQTVLSYEVINPLPISFDEGIIDIAAFTKDSGRKPYEKLFESFTPEVIHVHTLMGLHRSFLEAAKARNIRLVFTAHDFFPICPKVTMFRHGTVCDSVQMCEKCGVCNTTALSLKKIEVLQSPIYRKLKDSFIVKRIRKHHRDKYLGEAAGDDFFNASGTAADYKKLRNYYYSLLKLMDIIHYNSSLTKWVYESFFDLPNNCIINITHSDVKDNKLIKKFSRDKLRIRYLGPNGSAKGFFVLESALNELWKKQKNFCLDIHFTPSQRLPYINIHDRYTYADLKKIFDETDILIVPSIWYETFGFTVIEALSYGVPIIISGTVGAKDVMVDGAGIVIDNINPEKLCEVLANLRLDDLEKMNKIIVEKQSITQIKEMAQQIKEFCYVCTL